MGTVVLVTVVLASIAYLTLTARGMTALTRFILSFLENNNTRLFTWWAVALTLGVLYLLLCGGDGFASGTIVLDHRAQELAKIHPRAWMGKSASLGLGAWMCWVFGWTTFAAFLYATAYAPWAVRDEVGRAWEVALRLYRERRELSQNLPDITPTAQPIQTGATPGVASPPTGRLTLGRIFIGQFVSDFINELWSSLITRSYH